MNNNKPVRVRTKEERKQYRLVSRGRETELKILVIKNGWKMTGIGSNISLNDEYSLGIMAFGEKINGGFYSVSLQRYGNKYFGFGYEMFNAIVFKDAEAVENEVIRLKQCLDEIRDIRNRGPAL